MLETIDIETEYDKSSTKIKKAPNIKFSKCFWVLTTQVWKNLKLSYSEPWQITLVEFSESC